MFNSCCDGHCLEYDSAGNCWDEQPRRWWNGLVRVGISLKTFNGNVGHGIKWGNWDSIRNSTLTGVKCGIIFDTPLTTNAVHRKISQDTGSEFHG